MLGKFIGSVKLKNANSVAKNNQTVEAKLVVMRLEKKFL
jgi:hypothetical protein